VTRVDVTLRRFGIDTTFVRFANPSGEIADIEGLAAVAHAQSNTRS